MVVLFPCKDMIQMTRISENGVNERDTFSIKE